MRVLEQEIQQVNPRCWAELEAINKKFDAVEGRYGFPPKRRYRSLAGGHDTDVLVIEREFESLAAAEAAYEKAMADPEFQALGAELMGSPIVTSLRRELYTVLP